MGPYDAVLGRVLRDNFEFAGFIVAWKRDGHIAVGKARAFIPDLILPDVMLTGGESGFDRFGVLRQRRRTPVIILTAKGQKAHKLRGLALGADDDLTKPFDIDELLARAHAVLRRTRPSIDRVTLASVDIDSELESRRTGPAFST